MTADEVEELLRLGESQRLEFKEEAIKPGDLAQTIVALANAQGGIVLLGVSDTGQPVGIHSYQQAYDLVMTAASRELCDPPIRLGRVELVSLPNELHILAVSVPRSQQLHSSHGRFLVRRGSQNVALTTAEVSERSRRLDTGGLTALRLSGGYQSLYEVLDYAATLTLQDAQGQAAILEREQEIRFLQDGVVGLYHQVWGAGELFDEYDVEPGVVADRFQQGARHITLISLRQIRNRGDHLRLRIRRQIRQGWTESEEWLEIAVNHRTRTLRMAVIFPADRPPQNAALVEESTGQTHELNRRDWQVDAEGRVVLAWKTERPPLGETYMLRWHW